MAENKDRVINNLDDILGGGTFTKPEDLIDQDFEILSVAGEEPVIGYESPALRLNIKVGDEETTWSTFSEVIKGQVSHLQRLNLLPAKVSLIEVKSKTRGHNPYYRLTFPKS